jgi:very-short-patch-repair endonuclease
MAIRLSASWQRALADKKPKRPTVKIPRAPSAGEETFALHLRGERSFPKWEREFTFHSDRKFRFDFAFPDRKVAVEIEGGTWSGGRHSRGSGFSEDTVKYNAAAVLGWRVFRFTTEQVLGGSAIQTMRALFA